MVFFKTIIDKSIYEKNERERETDNSKLLEATGLRHTYVWSKGHDKVLSPLEKDIISSFRLGARKVEKSIYNNIYQRETETKKNFKKSQFSSFSYQTLDKIISLFYSCLHSSTPKNDRE